MSPNFFPGDCLGHYEIKSQLGAGGMGEVYLAQERGIYMQRLASNPDFEGLHSDPRFPALLKKMESMKLD
jgi:serine/threonine protein kinase